MRMMHEQKRRQDVRSGLVGGAVLVSIGAHLLLREVLNIDLGQYGWPFFIIGPGLLLFAGMIIGGRGSGGLAIPGSIVTTIGLILFVMNLTNHFEAWAYSWALIPSAVGVGLILAGGWDGNEKQLREGKDTLRVGLLLFLGFGTFFELFIFQNHPLAPYLLPVGMIIGGIALVAWNVLRARRTPEPAVEELLETSSPDMWPL